MYHIKQNIIRVLCHWNVQVGTKLLEICCNDGAK